MIHVLDSGPLGLLSNPLANPDAIRCHAWLDRLAENGHRVVTSEICEYEVRRELIRTRLAQSIARLDHLMMQFDVLPSIAGR